MKYLSFFYINMKFKVSLIECISGSMVFFEVMTGGLNPSVNGDFMGDIGLFC